MDWVGLVPPHQKIPFLTKIDPKGKNVEIWMNEVESGMKAAFKSVLWDSIVDYTQIPRPEWIQKYPGQAVRPLRSFAVAACAPTNLAKCCVHHAGMCGRLPSNMFVCLFVVLLHSTR